MISPPVLRQCILSTSLVFLVGLAGPAAAAKFSVKDLSGTPNCSYWNAIGANGTHPEPSCYPNPDGTLEVTITPEPDELPVNCHDASGRIVIGNTGSFCTYAASFYVAANYRGHWFVKPGYVWTPVEIANISPATQWPLWSGTKSMAYIVHVGELNLNTGSFDPPFPGLEVYVAIAPLGAPSFSPAMVAKVYPVPQQP